MTRALPGGGFIFMVSPEARSLAGREGRRGGGAGRPREAFPHARSELIGCTWNGRPIWGARSTARTTGIWVGGVYFRARAGSEV